MMGIYSRYFFGHIYFRVLYILMYDRELLDLFNLYISNTKEKQKWQTRIEQAMHL